jgi:predicted permease
VWGTVRANPSEHELERELEAHLSMAEEALRRQGHSPREAARLARLRFDTVPRALDALHEQRGLPWLGRFSLDLTLGARRLRKSWPLTVIGGLAMTLAIAIAAGGFSFVRALSGGPVPLDEGDRVVALQAWSVAARRAQNPAPEDFVRWREELRSVDDVGAFRTVSRALVVAGDTPLPGSEDDVAGVVSVAEMTAAGFRLARVPPLLGRALVEADERAGAEPVVVIGYDAWRVPFSGDPQIVGRQVRLDGVVHTVVGVMPECFAFPINHRYWVPLRADSAVRSWLEGPEILAFGRLAPGATLESAQGELETLGLATRPARSDAQAEAQLHPRISPYTQAFLSLEEGWSGLIMLLFTMLLLPPCANIAILVYARTVVRQEEFAVRAALGASRGRIVVQLFVEMLLLSTAAAFVALLLVQGVLTRAQIGLSQSPGATPFWMDLGISVGSAFYVAGLATLAGAIAGIVPAIQATGSLMQGGLRSLGGSGGGLRLGRVWSAMIVTQIALAMLILPSAVNLGWGFLRPVLSGPGFAAEEYATARVQFFGPTALFAERQAELIRLLQAEGGIKAIAISQSVPGVERSRLAVELEQTESAADDDGRAAANELSVTPNRVGLGFFDALEVPLLAGRTFDAGDFEPGRNSVVVNRAFAEQIASGQRVPLGQRIRDRFVSGVSPAAWHEIVGVVADFPANDETPRLYLPMTPGQTTPITLIVGANPGATAIAGRLREIARSADPALVVDEIRSLDALYLDQRAQSGAAVSALTVVTLSVLLLSAAGMYALMSFTVNQRRREIGIRSALGAPPVRLLAGTFRRPLGQLSVGAVFGLLAAYVLGAVLPIEELGGREVPGALLAAPMFMLVVAALAVAGPARRALRVIPTEALRDGG